MQGMKATIVFRLPESCYLSQSMWASLRVAPSWRLVGRGCPVETDVGVRR